MSTYQPGIPTGTVNLDQDYLNIQGNFQQLNTTFAVDHTSFANQTLQNGYHKTIHQIPFSTTTSNAPNNQPVAAPTATSGYGQLFSAQINDGINTDEALYWLTGGNKLVQLTRNFNPVLAANGYTMLPGGLILQWGVKNPTSSNLVTIPFNITFPNNLFTVTYSLVHVSSSITENTTYIVLPTFTNQFVIQNTTGHTFGYLWWAIGN